MESGLRRLPNFGRLVDEKRGRDEKGGEVPILPFESECSKEGFAAQETIISEQAGLGGLRDVRSPPT